MATTLALASCQTDDILDNSGSAQNANNAIRFDGEAGKMSRAEDNDAHTKLGDKFVVYGTKTTNEEGSSNKTSVVYNNYNVEWKENTTNSSTNTNGWEYVGVDKNTLNTTENSQQNIKYWDYSASQYDFVAFSFGSATQGTEESQISAEQDDSNKHKYTLTGKADELVKCYIADKVTINSTANYNKPVKFTFHSIAAKVKLAIYETIPGYSVKNVNFYNNSESATAPTLYAENKTIPAGKGTMTIDLDQSSASYTTVEGSENSSSIVFSGYSTVEKEGQETDTNNKYIGRSSSTASKTGFTNVIPANVGKLTLKVDYTLESTDGSGEEIKVKGATAEIPAQYTNWQANYAYTYIFKITDKTNGSTGGDSKGLYPITFDAIVTENENGIQETITTIDEPSITTYAKGAVTEEYNAGSNIYISVANKTLTLAEGGENCALYRVTSTGYDITNANVALCLSKTKGSDGSYKLTNGNNNLTVTPVKSSEEEEAETDKLTIEENISAGDSPTGTAIPGNFAKFKAAGEATGTSDEVNYNYYVFEYTEQETTQDAESSTAKKYYKIIKIKAKKA